MVLNEEIENGRVVLDAAFDVQDPDRDRMRPGRVIRASGGQCIEAVDDRQDAREQGDVGTLQAVGIAASIPMFVMVPHDPGHLRMERDVALAKEDAFADGTVRLHQGPFFRIQGTLFPQQRIGKIDLAHVVQASGQAEHGKIMGRQAQQSAQPYRKPGDPFAMLGGGQVVRGHGPFENGIGEVGPVIHDGDALSRMSARRCNGSCLNPNSAGVAGGANSVLTHVTCSRK